MKKTFLMITACLSLAACGFGPGVFDYSVINDQCRTHRINTQEAFQQFKHIADTKNTAGAQLLVARMYAQGIGAPRNIDKAKAYYEKAAQSKWRYGVNDHAAQELAELQQKGKLLRSRTVCPSSNGTGGLFY